jgi:hypothetical protein
MMQAGLKKDHGYESRLLSHQRVPSDVLVLVLLAWDVRCTAAARRAGRVKLKYPGCWFSQLARSVEDVNRGLRIQWSRLNIAIGLRRSRDF